MKPIFSPISDVFFFFFSKTYCFNLFVIQISKPMNKFKIFKVSKKMFLLFNISSFLYHVTLTYK